MNSYSQYPALLQRLKLTALFHIKNVMNEKCNYFLLVSSDEVEHRTNRFFPLYPNDPLTKTNEWLRNNHNTNNHVLVNTKHYSKVSAVTNQEYQGSC